MRQAFDPALIDRVVLGCVNVIADEMNPARVAALRLGLPDTVPAHTVQINCGSGMLAIDDAMRAVADGDRRSRWPEARRRSATRRSSSAAMPFSGSPVSTARARRARGSKPCPV